MSMNIRKIVNFLQGYRKLKVMAIVEDLAIVANLKGQFVGIIKKDALPDSETFSGRASDTMKKIAVVTPASYKHDRDIKLIAPCNTSELWWGLDKDRKELVIIRDLEPKYTAFTAIAANVSDYIDIPFVEPA